MLNEKNIKHFMSLTPRLELKKSTGKTYTNISDINASLEAYENDKEIVITSKSALISGKEALCTEEQVVVTSTYVISEDKFEIRLSLDRAIKGELTMIYPVICSAKDKIKMNENSVRLTKKHGNLSIKSNYIIQSEFEPDQRVYNFIPGLQAYPLAFNCNNLQQKELIIQFKV